MLLVPQFDFQFDLTALDFSKYVDLTLVTVDFNPYSIFIWDSLFASNVLYYSHIFNFMQFSALFEDI